VKNCRIDFPNHQTCAQGRPWAWNRDGSQTLTLAPRRPTPAASVPNTPGTCQQTGQKVLNIFLKI
jgi:hypothetical protein